MLNTLGHTVASLLFAVTIGHAESSTNQPNDLPGRSDVICFAVAIHLGQEGNQENQEAAQLLAMYYFGRAQAQLSVADLMAELSTVVPRIAGENWQVERARCSAGLRVAGEQLARLVDAAPPTVEP